jgi:KaiC/GvpD/RAD55 family RecA-like ATPase
MDFNRNFAYSIGRNREDAHPQRREARSFDELQDAILCARHDRPKDEAPYFARPFAANGKDLPQRAQQFALPCAWIALDVDRCTPEAAEALAVALAERRGFWHASMSATPENLKRRVVLACSRAVELDEHPRVVAAVESWLAERVGAGLMFDHVASRDVARLWYLPAEDAPAGAFMGAPIDVDRALAHAPARRKAEKRTADESKRTHEGGRNAMLTHEAGRLRRLGLSPAVLGAALQQMNVDNCDPPLDQDEVNTIARSVGRYPPAENESKTLLPLIWAREAGPMLDAPYIVKGVIGPGELIVIYGPPKSGKTFFATDLGLRVAMTQSWFGHRVKSGLVIYIASEMGRRAERRVRAWLDHHLGEVADRDLPFAIVPRVVNLLDEVQVKRLVATLESLIATRGKPALLVVDTLARSMAGGDENAAQDMGLAIAVADRLRDQFDTATVLVHHAGKDVSKGSRGSSALLGAADAYILVESDQAGGHIATVEWSRDSEAGQRYGFRLRLFDLGADVDGDMATTCILIPSAEAAAKPAKAIRRDVALDALREAIGEYGERMPGTSTIPKGIKAATLEQWRSRWILRTGYDPGRSAEVNFSKDKALLLRAGKVVVSRPYAWIPE